MKNTCNDKGHKGAYVGAFMMMKEEQSSRHLTVLFGLLAVLVVVLCSWAFFKTKSVEADVRPSEGRLPAAKWLNGWSYRKSHQLIGSAGAGTGYTVTVKAHRATGTDNGTDVYLGFNARADFGDIRFTDNDGKTVLPYWLEEQNGSDATFRVRVSDNLNYGQSIFIYYGRNTAAYSGSGAALFPDLFADFERSVQTKPLVTLGTDGFARDTDGVRIPESGSGAVHFAGPLHNRTYIAYADVDSDAMITYYDHDTREIGTPVNIGVSIPPNDPHANPHMVIDADGYVYVFWGTHSSNQQMRRTLIPEDITQWEVTKVLTGRFTYHQIFFINSTMYWFYRNQWGGQWVFRTSTDYRTGDWTWSEEHIVIDEPGTQVPYPQFVLGNETPTPYIHVAWNVYDGTLWRDVYYAYSDDLGVSWKKRDGTPLPLPLSQNNADVVYLFDFIHGWVNDVQLTPQHQPVIMFFEADDGSVPYKIKIARYENGQWVQRLVTDTPVSRYNLPVMRMEPNGDMKMFLTVGGDPGGNQPGVYGGEVQEYSSTDNGDTWQKVRDITANSPFVNYFIVVAKEAYTDVPVANEDLQIIWSYGMMEPSIVMGWGPGLGVTSDLVTNDPGQVPGWWRLNTDATFTVTPDGVNGQGATFTQDWMPITPGSAYRAITPIMTNNDKALETRIKVSSNPAETFYYVRFSDQSQSSDAGPVVAFRNDGTIAYQGADGIWQAIQSYDQNLWYHLKIFNINLANGTFDIAINGTMLRAGCSFRMPASVLNRVGAGGIGQFPNTVVVSDNYLIRRNIPIEPGHGSWGREENYGEYVQFRD